jgi:hypothetical protein
MLLGVVFYAIVYALHSTFKYTILCASSYRLICTLHLVVLLLVTNCVNSKTFALFITTLCSSFIASLVYRLSLAYSIVLKELARLGGVDSSIQSKLLAIIQYRR